MCSGAQAKWEDASQYVPYSMSGVLGAPPHTCWSSTTPLKLCTSAGDTYWNTDQQATFSYCPEVEDCATTTIQQSQLLHPDSNVHEETTRYFGAEGIFAGVSDVV